MINYGKQFIDTADINAVIKVLNSSWLTQGPEVKKFENKLNIFFGSKYSCVVSNGTAALHLAGLALGWKKGEAKKKVLSLASSWKKENKTNINRENSADFANYLLFNHSKV